MPKFPLGDVLGFLNYHSSHIASGILRAEGTGLHLNRPISKIISDEDLRQLIYNLEGNLNAGERWEDVIDRKSDQFSYMAKCCRPKEGPLKYLSATVFENCSTEMLRDFYMDNEYRKAWDKTLVDHQQLEVDEASGTEVGRTIKKFPLLSLREYVLAWRVWGGDCEHPSTPRQKKLVRVGFFRSGWLAGTDACEIKMVHQEDAGLNVELARIAFAKGIWSYICKMNSALRDYSLRMRPPLPMLVQVPLSLEGDTETVTPGAYESSSGGAVLVKQTGGDDPGENLKLLSRKPSKTWIAKGLLLVGGIVCLSRGHSTLGTQLAVACILKKLMSRRGMPRRARRDRPGCLGAGGGTAIAADWRTQLRRLPAVLAVCLFE
ncbi:unnamed protein product [Spirodela intermedia]|uniref:START domain-containing protein n=1 Tax=Spirodela intermedia TaxID=51605 RepID=A0A7I8JM25_SPIIN|nr:unnamed protein product [Spirodela intermedia]CAA6671217.1 unnamed protein product [Spirodela intermedia]